MEINLDNLEYVSGGVRGETSKTGETSEASTLNDGTLTGGVGIVTGSKVVATKIADGSEYSGTVTEIKASGDGTLTYVIETSGGQVCELKASEYKITVGVVF